MESSKGWDLPEIESLVILKNRGEITDKEYDAFSNLEKHARGKVTHLSCSEGYGGFVFELRTDKILNPHWVFSDIHELHLINGRMVFYVEMQPDYSEVEAEDGKSVEIWSTDVDRYYRWNERFDIGYDVLHFDYDMITEDEMTGKIKSFIKRLDVSDLICNSCHFDEYGNSFDEKFGRLEMCEYCHDLTDVSNVSVNREVEELIGAFDDRSMYYEFVFEEMVNNLRDKGKR